MFPVNSPLLSSVEEGWDDNGCQLWSSDYTSWEFQRQYWKLSKVKLTLPLICIFEFQRNDMIIGTLKSSKVKKKKKKKM